MGTDTAGDTAAPPSPAPAEPAYRYAAFISYRHAPADRRWAMWLHRALESYRVPKRLQRSAGLPPRVGRCFRDEEELAASADLSAEIDEALQKSRFLVVVCSPRTPASEWVNREVERFREMGRGDHILALLIEGEPADSFPRALREIRTACPLPGYDESAARHVRPVEPLAADVRPLPGERPSFVRRMARLRLLAEVLGVSFDDLRQREQERRVRRLGALSGGMAALLAVFAAVSAVAVYQWRKADALTRQAQALTTRALTGESAAVQQKAEADRQKADAQARARDARRRLADRYARDGWAKVDAGDLSTALLWFARALETTGNDPADEADAEHARIRLAATLAAAPRLLDPDVSDALSVADMRTSRGRRLEVKEKEVNIVSADTGQPLTPPLRHEGTVWTAAFSPDGRRVATASLDETARVWDAATGQPLTPPLVHDVGVLAAAFSPDGRRIATAGGTFGKPGEARVWDAATGAAVTPPLRHETFVGTVAFSPDGSKVATTGYDRTAQVWDAATGRPVTPPLRHGADIVSATVDPDGWRVTTFDVDRRAAVWDTAPGLLAAPPLRHGDWVLSVAFNSDGRRLVTASHDKTARVWDAITGRPVTPPLPHEHFVEVAAFSPDGRRVVTGSRDRTARVWDAATGDPVTPPLRHEQAVCAAAFSPDGRRVVTAVGGIEGASAGTPGEARVWDAATGRPVAAAMRHEHAVRAAAFSPDGRRVVTAAGGISGGGDARVWDAATGEPVTPPLRHEGVVWHAGFSPDGRRVLTACGGSGKGEARVWDAATGRPLTPPLRHGDAVLSAAFDPGGRRVVTASEDKTARVWDAATGEPVTPPLRHEHFVLTAAFSPDGRRVVTASVDSTARVWDAATGQPLTPPLRHERNVEFAAFSPDGRRVATASHDQTARVWDVGPDGRSAGDLMALAELLAGRRVDATDGLVPLTSDEWRVRWDDLRKKYPADFRPRRDWVYEAMGLPATQPATAPTMVLATRPDSGGGR